MSLKGELFNIDMVRALLEGRKVHTARPIKNDFETVYKMACTHGKWDESFGAHIPHKVEKCNGYPNPEKCAKCDVSKEIVDRLAAYEDTCLSPSEVATMKERTTPKEPVNIAEKVGIVGGNCPVCHALVFSAHKFCGRCGHALKWPKPPEVEQK